MRFLHEGGYKSKHMHMPEVRKESGEEGHTCLNGALSAAVIERALCGELDGRERARLLGEECVDEERVVKDL